MKAKRTRVGGLLLFLVSSLLAQASSRAQEPPKKDSSEEVKKLNDTIEKSIDWYDIFPDENATTALKPLPVIRWRNVIRGQEGEAMMVVWPHNGRPVAMASIYPWEGKMVHEFDSLSRDTKLIAREKDRVFWTPETAGVDFKDMPKAPKPAKTAAERLRQMKAIAERVKATMTGWRGDNADAELLRLLPRPLYRYDFANAKDPDPKLLDGALFAYVLGTDPEVVMVLEAIGTAEKAEWQYAFARATSGGLEVKFDDDVVFTASKYPNGKNPKLPHRAIGRLLEMP